MKHFLSTDDIDSLPEWLKKGRTLAPGSGTPEQPGLGKTLCLLFLTTASVPG